MDAGLRTDSEDEKAGSLQRMIAMLHLSKSRYMTIPWLAGSLMASLFTVTDVHACSTPVSICSKAFADGVPLVRNGRPVPVVVDATADPAVQSAARAFASDLARVAGSKTGVLINMPPAQGKAVVLIGEIGHSPMIDGLIAAGRLSVTDIAGRWEAYRQITIDNPFPGIDRALVIVGADRRGVAYGAYDLSEKIGVSPWTWWADVPVRRQANLSVTKGARSDAPKVRYRGIFINDEEPAFGSWSRATFGGINAALYDRVFDLLLRLKGNYLWPAMWGKAIGADDPASMKLADAKGVILGTSHHEPMTRAQAEWHIDKGQGVRGGAWDYTTNAENLRTFWRGGIHRMMTGGTRGKAMDQLVTVGMRGDGDEPMGGGTAIGLLETIVADQRRIIADVTKRPASDTPQVWALYKEVQDYYDKGLRVPDDVTLLFADDNWGQVRRLPTGDLDRAGGYGVYYHFDYVGGPRSYKWVNTNQIEKTWQQMDLSYRRGAKALWIVNVGDVKPMEFPIDFFMKMAWDPEAMTPQALADFPRTWAAATFGEDLASAIGDLVSDYSRLAARRKPELVDADSFALGGVSAQSLDGGEFGQMVAEWDALAGRMAAARDRISPKQRDAWFQLIEYPIAAMNNLYHLYYSTAWNRRLLGMKDARANHFADDVEAAFHKDRDLVDAYHALGGGKWAGMMSQTKFGYRTWSDPKTEIMPTVARVATGADTVPPIRFAPADPREGRAVAVEAVDFVGTSSTNGLRWNAIPRLGRTAGAIVAMPQGAPSTSPADAVRVDYKMALPTAGDATVRLYMVPALDTGGGKGMRIGVSVDDGPMRTAILHLEVDKPDWAQAVRDNGFPIDVAVGPLTTGNHKVSLWRIDDNMAVQRVALFTGSAPLTYLGPAPAANGQLKMAAQHMNKADVE